VVLCDRSSGCNLWCGESLDLIQWTMNLGWVFVLHNFYNFVRLLLLKSFSLKWHSKIFGKSHRNLGSKRSPDGSYLIADSICFKSHKHLWSIKSSCCKIACFEEWVWFEPKFLKFCFFLNHQKILRCWVAGPSFHFQVHPRQYVLLGNHRAWILVYAKGAFFWAWQIWTWLAK
jgi:hypothetical protein